MKTTLLLEPVASSARTARDALRGLLSGVTTGQSVVDTVLLLTSELVMNSVLHGEGPALLDARVSPDVVHVAVTDAGRGEPVVNAHPGEADDHGRGLLLVEQLATRWGVRSAPEGGKTVWFELAYRRSV